MGLTWAVGWALTGLGIGALSLILPDAWTAPFFRVFDAPLPALAVPGFVGGALFSVVLSVAARRRRFDQLSLPGFTLLGAAGGALLAVVPTTMVLAGLATLAEGLSLWRLTAVTAIPLTALSAASAAATLVIARKAQGPGDLGPIDALPDAADVQALEQGTPAATSIRARDRSAR